MGDDSPFENCPTLCQFLDGDDECWTSTARLTDLAMDPGCAVSFAATGAPVCDGEGVQGLNDDRGT